MSVATDTIDVEVSVREGSPQDAWAVAEHIGEFGGDADRFGRQAYERRLSGPGGLVLIAYAGDQMIGFKAGYDRYRDGSWYGWMGGVVEPWRGRGVAQRLLDAQEAWVRKAGYGTLYVKTRNRHKRMIAFLAANGFDVLRVEAKSAIPESRILFCKRFATAPDPDLRR